MVSSLQKTLVSSLSELSSGPGRGFRFLARDGSDVFIPYEDIRAEAYRRAAFMGSLGLEPGSRVALVIPDPKEFVLTFLGAVVAGVVPVPIFPRASFKNIDGYVDVLDHITAAAGAPIVFTMESVREIVERLNERDTGIQKIALVEDTFVGEAPAFEAPEVTPEDLCFLQFTSGSTSKPKGVMVTHANLVANASAFLGPEGLDRTKDDVGVSWLPLYHDMGLIGFVLGTLICDIPVVLIPTESFVRRPKLWLDTIAKYKGTITYAPNFAYDLVTKRVKDKDLPDLDLSTLRTAGCGAEPIRALTLQRFADKFAAAGFRRDAFLPSYGMAEATLAITFHPRGTEMVVDKVDANAMKDGVARPATESTETVLEIVGNGRGFSEHGVKIVDDAGEELGERRVGQVVARGPSITGGYFQNPEATADAFRDGWLQTGDLGYFADGHLFICGRVKDLIIIRGANHYPQDIEWAVADLEGVRRGNVFAFSVIKDGLEALVLAAECSRKAAPELSKEIPKAVMRGFSLNVSDLVLVPVGTLPKTSSGKAQRRKTKLLYEAGELPRFETEA